MFVEEINRTRPINLKSKLTFNSTQFIRVKPRNILVGEGRIASRGFGIETPI